MVALVLAAILVNYIYASSSLDIDWKSVEGELSSITIGRDYDTGAHSIYGVSSSGQVWTCQLPCDGGTNRWRQIPGQSSAVSVAVNAHEVLALSSDGTIMACKLPCTRGVWKSRRGLLMRMSSGPEVLWGVNRENGVYRTLFRSGQEFYWTPMSDRKMRFKMVAVGQDGEVYGLLTGGSIVRFTADGNQWIQRAGGPAKSISVGRDNVYLITSDDRLKWCKKPCADDKWKEYGQMQVKAFVEGGDDWVVALTPESKIYAGRIQKCPKLEPAKQEHRPQWEHNTPNYGGQWSPWWNYYNRNGNNMDYSHPPQWWLYMSMMMKQQQNQQQGGSSSPALWSLSKDNGPDDNGLWSYHPDNHNSDGSDQPSWQQYLPPQQYPPWYFPWWNWRR